MATAKDDSHAAACGGNYAARFGDWHGDERAMWESAEADV
jgi:hypothetical protein